MDRFTMLAGLHLRGRDNLLHYSAQEWDATRTIANSAARWMTGRDLSPKKLRRGAELVHHATASAGGSIYAAMVYRSTTIAQSKILSTFAGLCFGLGVWSLGDELLLPALGVLKREDYSAAMRSESLLAHMAYGAATGLVYHQLVAATADAE